MIDNLEKNNNINEIKSLITEIVDLKIDIQSKQSELQRYKNIYSNNYPKSILKILKDKDFKIQQSKALLVDKEKTEYVTTNIIFQKKKIKKYII